MAYSQLTVCELSFSFTRAAAGAEARTLTDLNIRVYTQLLLETRTEEEDFVDYPKDTSFLHVHVIDYDYAVLPMRSAAVVVCEPVS